MHVNFVAWENGPERLVCEAELILKDYGPLDGLKLVGFSLWRSAEGEIYVTFPSRAFGAGSERRFFDYLRAENGDGSAVKRLKGWMVDDTLALLVERPDIVGVAPFRSFLRALCRERHRVARLPVLASPNRQTRQDHSQLLEHDLGARQPMRHAGIALQLEPKLHRIDPFWF
jgi:hypothetical protein